MLYIISLLTVGSKTECGTGSAIYSNALIMTGPDKPEVALKWVSRYRGIQSEASADPA